MKNVALALLMSLSGLFLLASGHPAPGNFPPWDGKETIAYSALSRVPANASFTINSGRPAA